MHPEERPWLGRRGGEEMTAEGGQGEQSSPGSSHYVFPHSWGSRQERQGSSSG